MPEPLSGALPARRMLSVPQGPLLMHDLLVAGAHPVRAVGKPPCLAILTMRDRKRFSSHSRSIAAGCFLPHDPKQKDCFA